MSAPMSDDCRLLHRWLGFVYGHGYERPRPAAAVRMLEAQPDLMASDPILAAATGDRAAVEAAIAADASWVNRLPAASTCPTCGVPLGRPPLVAVTHSSLGQLPAFRDGIRACAQTLIAAGADANQSWDCGGHPLSALYGAVALSQDVEIVRLLLSRGANPNDGESLYHSIETPGHDFTRLLLEAGARVEGNNALHHQLDIDDIEGLRLLLKYTKDPEDRSSPLGPPLLWAIRRGRSRAHVDALLSAGASPHVRTHAGVSAYRQAARFGLTGVCEALAAAGASEPMEIEEQFVAACARADRAEAERILTERPDIIRALSAAQLQQLPNLAAVGNNVAVRLMVELGWPIATRGGDWSASALNLAVFLGDAALARFLLEHGASWKELHGHGDNVNGTLSWASRNQPSGFGDWVGCARALVDHGLPLGEADLEYSDEVKAFFDASRAERNSSPRATATLVSASRLGPDHKDLPDLKDRERT